MKTLDGDKKYGQQFGVLLDIKENVRIHGQMQLTRGNNPFDNKVNICLDRFLHLDDESCVHGVSEEGKVTLLDCRTLNQSLKSWGDFAISPCDLTFTYALFGDQHVRPDDRCIFGMRFSFDEIDNILSTYWPFDTFGQIMNPDKEILDAIERKAPDYAHAEFQRDGSALVSYFTGKFQILPETPTAIGTVSASRTLLYDMFGRGLEDKPYVVLDFGREPLTVEEAIERMSTLRQFFAWLIGYVPGWSEIRVFTSSAKNADGVRIDAEGQIDSGLHVIAPTLLSGRERPSSDVLLDAYNEPKQFSTVMKNWLERNVNPDRRSANTRYFGAMVGNATIEDRVVSAGNTFDLLPDCDKPSVSIAEDLRNMIRDFANTIKSDIPQSEERDGVLSRLGMIRADRSLFHTVNHRAKLVVDEVGDDTLPRFDLLLKEAVKCRNYYTHGPSGKSHLNLADPEVVMRLTRTLEFVYGVSEMLLCGWEIKSWIERANIDHPFVSFIKGYKMMLARLEIDQ